MAIVQYIFFLIIWNTWLYHTNVSTQWFQHSFTEIHISPTILNGVQNVRTKRVQISARGLMVHSE